MIICIIFFGINMDFTFEFFCTIKLPKNTFLKKGFFLHALRGDPLAHQGTRLQRVLNSTHYMHICASALSPIN